MADEFGFRVARRAGKSVNSIQDELRRQIGEFLRVGRRTPCRSAERDLATASRRYTEFTRPKPRGNSPVTLLQR